MHAATTTTTAVTVTVPTSIGTTTIPNAQQSGRRIGSSSRRRIRTRACCSFVEPLQKITTTTTTITTTSKTELRVKYKTFDEMISNHGDTPLLIDFYAPWCGPCKMMKVQLKSIGPQLEALGPRRAIVEEEDSFDSEDDDDDDDDTSIIGSDGTTKITTQPTNENDALLESKPSGIPVYHVNANKFPQVGARNKIHGLPTLVLYYMGEELWRNEGIITGGEIVGVLTQFQEEKGWTTPTATVAAGAEAASEEVV